MQSKRPVNCLSAALPTSAPSLQRSAIAHVSQQGSHAKGRVKLHLAREEKREREERVTWSVRSRGGRRRGGRSRQPPRQPRGYRGRTTRSQPEREEEERGASDRGVRPQ
eukprot:281141-Rhodomonas_salina.1